MTQAAYSTPPIVERIQQRSLIVGLAGAALCIIGAFFSPQQFYRSYLMGYLFYIGVALGCLGLVMLQYLSGGAWGIVIRRLLESATRTLPLLALLFVPVILGRRHLYVWTHPEIVEQSEVLRHKQAYLNVPFFLVRVLLYFSIWLLLAYFLNKWSREQDQEANPRAAQRLQAISGPGLVLYVLTVTFASIDWVMSIEPKWFSTIFGLLLMGGQGLSAMSFIIAAAILLAGREPMSRVFRPRHFQDLGKLLLMFTMLWAYFAFSQLLIIWEANLPEEIPWYLHRWQGGWQWVGIALIVFHFALPFVLLLSRDLKRNLRSLGAVASLIIVMRFVDLFWLTAPEFHAGQFRIHWLDFAIPLGLGGIWLAFFARQLKARPLLPLHDPDLESVFEKN
ncbi:MAG TPA: hypothetical protein VGQ81_01430 [Acidobacteriota bacterium]|jgi:hypothetical protein|nr:hypothetical protein [Acidobacteriota bacterium]